VASLRKLVLPMFGCALVIGFFETLAYAVIQHGLGRPATFFSVVSAIQGAGAIAGGLSATWLCRRLGELPLSGLGLVTSALGALLLAAHGLPIVAPGIVLFGLGLPWLLVGINTAIMRATPRGLQGRVDGALESAFSAPQVLSIALGAALVTVVDYRVLLLVAVAVLLAGGIAIARIGAVPNLVDAPDDDGCETEPTTILPATPTLGDAPPAADAVAHGGRR
jgi:MFS family permease